MKRKIPYAIKILLYAIGLQVVAVYTHARSIIIIAAHATIHQHAHPRGGLKLRFLLNFGTRGSQDMMAVHYSDQVLFTSPAPTIARNAPKIRSTAEASTWKGLYT